MLNKKSNTTTPTAASREIRSCRRAISKNKKIAKRKKPCTGRQSYPYGPSQALLYVGLNTFLRNEMKQKKSETRMKGEGKETERKIKGNV